MAVPDCFDRAGALAFLCDEALLGEVLDAFIASSQGQLLVLREAIAARDAESVRRYLHRVIPTLGILASKSLLAQANQVHQSWRDAQADADARAQRSYALADGIEALIAQVIADRSGPSATP
jgi:HPt (histidine-containing phosphotransfer) domain-containing protein